MKTIFYFLILSLICITAESSIQKKSKDLFLKSTDKNVSSELLSQSATIISNRLKTYNLEASVSIISDKREIKVQINDNIILSEIEGLLTTKGNLGLYETLTAKELSDLSGKELNPMPCSSFENKQVSDSVENILKSENLQSYYKLLWGLKNSKSLTCLYAVKINSALTKADIDTIKSSKDSNSKLRMEIIFKPASAKIWADITKQNLNKPIAIA
ncbi:MAG: hypothetical protein ACM3RX_02245, partial [Methanococcaceae archaeon]